LSDAQIRSRQSLAGTDSATIPGSINPKHNGMINLQKRRPVVSHSYRFEGRINRYASQCNTFYIACKDMLQDINNAKKSKNKFCSKECRAGFIRSESAGNAIKKHRPEGGHHVLIKTHGHPRGGRHNQVYEHILVVEARIGRYLTPTERVHHINLIKNDNRSENLFLCESDRAHFKIHGSLNRCVASLLASGAIRFNHDAQVYEVTGDDHG
jgi:hypothetical protein